MVDSIQNTVSSPAMDDGSGDAIARNIKALRERAWWDDALARLQAVADACDSLTAEQRHRVIRAAASIGDLDAAISAQETALGEVMREESDLADTDAAVWVQSQGAEVPA